MDHIADREASKTYLTRVRGLFPETLDAQAQQSIIETAQSTCAGSKMTF
jgi:predicted LPLAT superfamily acyltransferase